MTQGGEAFASLLESLAASTADFGRILRSLDESSAVTLGGQWTVRQTAVHVLGSAKHYCEILEGGGSFIGSWADLEVFNRTLFLAIDEDRPHELASMIEADEGTYRAAAAAHDPDELLGFHMGGTLTVADLVAFSATSC